MTFSVVIPAYNGELFIESAIQSVLNQIRKADEIIVHDDNSTDTTATICKKYSSEIRYYSNNNGPSGFVNAWNKAIALASSDYISILHQDDILYPDFLKEAETAFTNNPECRHLFSLCDYITDLGKTIVDSEKVLNENYQIGESIIFNGKEYAREYQKTYPGLAHIHRCPGVITHRTIFESGCVYNPEAGHIADDDFFFRVGQYTSVIGIIKSLASFRIHDESETGKIGETNLVKRLSADYMFQLKQWKDSDYMSSDLYLYFVRKAFKFTNRLLGYGIKNLDIDLIKSALINYDKLDEIGLSNTHKGIEILRKALRLVVL